MEQMLKHPLTDAGLERLLNLRQAGLTLLDSICHSTFPSSNIFV
jgi:hypothetical protein